MSVATATAAAASTALVVIGTGRLLAARAPGARGRARAVRRAGPIGRTRTGAGLAARLGRAGLPLGPDAFVALVGAAALAAGVLAGLTLRQAPAGVVSAAMVAGAALALLRSADARHLARVEAQLPGVARQLAAGLGAGLSLRRALARAVSDAPEPARGELSGIVRDLELGGRIEDALQGALERVPVHDMRVMVTAILVQRRTGGNLARALATLAERLDEHGRLARELRGATAQARTTAWLVAALPAAGGVLAELAAPGTLARVVGQPPGPQLLVVAGALYALGVVLIRRIGRVEP